MRILVTGAGGFIGGHLVSRLKADGHWVRAVDIKRHEFRASEADDVRLLDMRIEREAALACEGVEQVYALAADMGGIGHITAHLAEVAHNNVLCNANTLEAARQAGVHRYLYTSSACVYPARLQRHVDAYGLRESDAIPAEPEAGYGWEKLFSEQLAAYYRRDYGLDTRIVRLHNVFGPLGTWWGGREKAPAAICRQVAEVREGEEITLWGDGNQTRSFCYIDDAVEGLVRLMASDHAEPINLGTEEMVSIAVLAEMVLGIAGKTVRIKWDPSKPQGVRGRNSDNRVLRSVLEWEPTTRLVDGLSKTYPWISEQISTRSV